MLYREGEGRALEYLERDIRTTFARAAARRPRAVMRAAAADARASVAPARALRARAGKVVRYFALDRALLGECLDGAAADGSRRGATADERARVGRLAALRLAAICASRGVALGAHGRARACWTVRMRAPRGCARTT